MNTKIKATILGASGYTGVGLFKLCTAHPGIEVIGLSAERHAGEKLSDVFPHVAGVGDMEMIHAEEAAGLEADVAFCCLPHTAAMAVVPKLLASGTKVFDLSADFRMDTAESYQKWYNVEHEAPELLEERVYGLAEFNRNQIRTARLVAVPGCYPTSVQIGLVPLLKAGMINPQTICVDSKSGVSGAGRKLSQRTHYVETNENLAPYNVGRVHRHVGEIEQELSRAAGTEATAIFVPHLTPMNQGILSTSYVDIADGVQPEALMETLEETYSDDTCVRVTEHLPETAFVMNTNYADVSVRPIEGTGKAIVFCAIDNLVKGAYGQALQCMNIACGFDETTGLPL